MAKVGLRIKKPFQQGTPSYKPQADATAQGAFVPDDHWTGWEQITLSNRLKNEFVAWEPVPEDGAVTVDEPTIAELDKDGLILYAEQRFNVRLDKRASEKNMREQIGAMQDRDKLIRAQDARGVALQRARQGESAATVGAKGSATSAKPVAKSEQKPEPTAPPVPPVTPSVTAPAIDPTLGTGTAAGGTPVDGTEGGAAGSGTDSENTQNTQTTDNTGTGSPPPAP